MHWRDWSSGVCSSDLGGVGGTGRLVVRAPRRAAALGDRAGAAAHRLRPAAHDGRRVVVAGARLPRAGPRPGGADHHRPPAARPRPRPRRAGAGRRPGRGGTAGPGLRIGGGPRRAGPRPGAGRPRRRGGGAVTVALYALIGGGALLALVRLALGPSLLDRVVATGTLLVIISAGLAVYAALERSPTVVPVLVVVSLLAFVGSVSVRSEEHTSELQSRQYLVCRLLLE